MARILLDCTLIDFARQPTGIPRVVLKYIEEGYRWAEETGNEVIPVVPSSEGMWLVRPVPGDDAPARLLALANQSVIFEAASSMQTASDEPPHKIQPGAGDVLFSPAYWHDNDPQLYRGIKASGCKIAILVHDILPIAHKQFYQSPWRYRFSAAVLQALDHADRLYAVSDVTRRDLVDFAQRRGRTMPPIEVAHNGFQNLVSSTVVRRIREGKLPPRTSDPQVRRALAGPAPLLMVGSVEPKKGHIPVIKCLEAMWAAGFERNLLIIGRPGWMEKEMVDYIISSPLYGTRLFWMSGLDDFDLAYFYLHAHALLFASIAEGFGLPMIEAAMLGKPVVVLDTPIAREVLGGHGHYFDDAARLMDTIVRLEDPDHYAAACADMAGFDWPTWRSLVPGVMDGLAELADLPATADVPPFA